MTCLLCLWASATFMRADEKATVFVEAEDERANGDVIVRDQPGCFGGSYATTGRDWNPVFSCNVPEESGNYRIFVRARGYNMILKAMDEAGAQHQLKAVFQVPATWSWIDFGSFSREQLRRNLWLIRSAGGSQDAGIDAVILTTDPEFHPDKLSPEAMAKLAFKS